MRDPALHITRSKLIEVLRLQGIRITETQATNIIAAAKPYQLKRRHVVQGNVRQQTKSQKLAETDNPITEIFQRILVSYRQSIGHKVIVVIKKSDPSYLMLREVAGYAYEFVEIFKLLPREDGYKKFIQIGLHLMGRKYAINRFKTYKDRIFEVYENLTIVDKDSDKAGTEEFYTVWKELMLEYASLERELTDFDKVNMVYGRQDADEVEAYYDHWLRAQFDGLAFLNAIPELSQLHGPQAKKRYEKYLTVLSQEDKPKDDNLPTAFESDEEAEYYRKLRTKN